MQEVYLPLIDHCITESNETLQSKAEEKARIFYKSCIDVNKTIETLGAKPVKSIIEVRKITLFFTV